MKFQVSSKVPIQDEGLKKGPWLGLVGGDKVPSLAPALFSLMQLHFKSTSSQASGQYNCKLTRQGKVAKNLTDYQCGDARLPLFSLMHVHLKSTESYEHQDKAKWSGEDMNAIQLVIWQGKITQNTLIFDMVLVRHMRTLLVKRGQYVPNNAWSNDTCSFQIEHSAEMHCNTLV